jgi:hypothetical protein
MCFCASASFGASAVLAVIGVASLTQVQRKNQILFASIPLFFSAQQCIEGITWLSFANPPNPVLNGCTTYIFLTFAQVFWPLYIPFAMVLVAGKERRKKIQWLFVAMGIAEAAYQIWCLVYCPCHSEIRGHHVYYEIDHPAALNYVEPLFYIGAILAPPFFTKVKGMWFMAVANLISCLITFIYFIHFTFSIWCFFAAIISIAVFYIMRENKTISNGQLTMGN